MLHLGGVTPDDRVPLQPLIDAVSRGREPEVFWAVVALGRLKDPAAVAVPLLCKVAAEHPAFGVRQAALIAIAKIAPGDERVKAAVLAAFKDPSPFVRRQALQETIKLGGLTPDELAAIKACENDPDEAVADWSEIALRNIRLRGTGGSAS